MGHKGQERGAVLELFPVEDVGEGTFFDGGRLGGMADGDDADEGVCWGRAECCSDDCGIGLRRTGDPAGTEAMGVGCQEKILGGCAAILHRTGGGSGEDEYAKGGICDELSVSEEWRDAGESCSFGKDDELPGLLVHGSGGEAGTVNDLLDDAATDWLWGVRANAATRTHSFDGCHGGCSVFYVMADKGYSLRRRSQRKLAEWRRIVSAALGRRGQHEQARTH